MNRTKTKSIYAESTRIPVASQMPKEGHGACAAFTAAELLVVIVVLAILAAVPFSARGNAKSKSRQLSCLNNLRQLGTALRMYIGDYRQCPGSYSPTANTYVWPTRLLSETGVERNLFSCPAAARNSWWDTNFNATLGGRSESGGTDPFAVTAISRFSIGYNDWGLNISARPQLGLGGDVSGAFYQGPVSDSMVVAPARMIALGDLPATQNAIMISFNASLDPTDTSSAHNQRLSNRHSYRTDILFVDGHCETPFRNDVISSSSSNPWRNRWNNDNRSHNEVAWPTGILNQLDP